MHPSDDTDFNAFLDIYAEIEARVIEGNPIYVNDLYEMADRAIAPEQAIELNQGIDL